MTYTADSWNKKAHHPLQSWEWGAMRETLGYTVIRFDDGKDVYQGAIHKVPGLGASIFYIPRSVLPSEKALDLAKELGARHKAICVKWEPYHQVKKDSGNKDQSHFTRQTKESPFPLFPQWTQHLDISPTEEEILARMKPKTRYNIRLAFKKGVTTYENTTEKGFENFYLLYSQTCARQNYKGHSKQYHSTVFSALHGKIAHIIQADFKKKPLCSYELFLFNRKLYYPYGGSSELHRDLMAPHALMWYAIQLGKQYGAIDFDMWGSLAPDYSHDDAWAGFTRFKEGFGTTFVEYYPSRDQILRPSLYTVFGIAYHMRKILLRYV
ncbi:MAG: Lipid II:glycine glycyltransferase [Microgenomates bacterium OLB22]|nr:MAG: Lipid II:glycine glycyltransferase [Microgenomates bacterium OLB22]